MHVRISSSLVFVVFLNLLRRATAYIGTARCSPGTTYAVASSTDCSRYAMCTNGTPLYYRCSDGYVFDYCSQTCTHVWSTCSQISSCACVDNPRCVRQAASPAARRSPGVAPAAQVVPPLMPAPPPAYPYQPIIPIQTQQAGYNLQLGYNQLQGWLFNMGLGVNSFLNSFQQQQQYPWNSAGTSNNFLWPTSSWLPWPFVQPQPVGGSVRGPWEPALPPIDGELEGSGEEVPA